MSTEELIVGGYALARDLGIRISSHIAGGTFSLEKGFLKHLRETGRTDVRYLMQLGVLDERWILAHCIHCTSWISSRWPMSAPASFTPRRVKPSAAAVSAPRNCC